MENWTGRLRAKNTAVLLLIICVSVFSQVEARALHFDALRIEVSSDSSTEHQTQAPSTSFKSDSDPESLLLGMFFGLMAVMAIYNLLLYFSLKDKAYLLYVGTVIFNILTTLSINGLGEQYFWPNQEGLDANIYATFAGVSIAFSSRFAAVFLKIEKLSKRLDKYLWLLTFLGLLLSILTAIFGLDPIKEPVRWFIFTTFPSYIIIGFYSYYRGFKPAFYYIIAWLPYILGIVIRTMHGAGWLPTNWLIINSIEIGGALEIVLLSFALADRIKSMRRELMEKEIEKEQFKSKLLEEQKVVLEKTVDERTKELQQANTTKDKFFSIIAHDLRSPLIGLQGIGQKLDYFLRKNKTEKLMEMGDQIDSSVDHINHLLNNLLNWATQETGKIPYHPTTINLRDLIIENVSLYASLAKTKEVRIDYQLEDVEAHLDLNTVSTVIRNLLSNSIKFSPTGDSVKITLTIGQSYAELCFSDNGPGINQEVKDQLQREELISSRQGSAGEKGFGLGLKLCNEFVRLNHGSLIIQSLQDKGTDVFVRFPLT